MEAQFSHSNIITLAIVKISNHTRCFNNCFSSSKKHVPSSCRGEHASSVVVSWQTTPARCDCKNLAVDLCMHAKVREDLPEILEAEMIQHWRRLELPHKDTLYTAAALRIDSKVSVQFTVRERMRAGRRHVGFFQWHCRINLWPVELFQSSLLIEEFRHNSATQEARVHDGGFNRYSWCWREGKSIRHKC